MPDPIGLGPLLLRGFEEGKTAVIGPNIAAKIREAGFYVVFAKDTYAGAVGIESAPAADFDGDWAWVAGQTWSGANRAHYIAVTGVHLALRIRILRQVAGGDVSVYGVAN